MVTSRKYMHGERRLAAALALSASLQILTIARTRAEDRVDYRYEDYAEDKGRIHIETHGAFFDLALKPWLSLKGNYIHDAISGATPTGAPQLPGRRDVPTVTIDDVRNAGFLEAGMRYGRHTISPQVAYSEESDYKSLGVSLTHAIEFNEKNTTVSWGVSQSFDEILPNEGTAISSKEDKDTTDFFIGLSQLLGPRTVLTGNLTLGYSDGYLSDPYKRVLFDGFPHTPGLPYTVFPEKRPDHRFRQVAYLSLRQMFESVNGSAEASYRFHHDDFGVIAHTAGLQWNQKIGKRIIVSPLFRYHNQDEADFYSTHFPGDPTIPGSSVPHQYSADYRLSALQSFTYGVSLSVKVHDHVTLNFAYKRYEMFGTDGETADDQYPKAHVFTGGLTVWF